VTTDGGGSARTPLEALLLALRHSRAAHLTGSTVLRQVLASSYREMVQGDNFELTPVWDLLASQPKFDPAEAMPAFAKVKSWESKLGKKVALPPLMQHLTETEITEMAGSIHVPASELAHVLRGGKVQTDHIDEIPEAENPIRRDAPRMRKPPRESTPPHGARDSSDKKKTKKKTRDKEPRLNPKQRRAAMVGAGLVALLAFGLAGMTLSRGCHSRSWNTVALDFAGELPLVKAERSGPEVSATLRDSSWLRMAANRRRDQMSAALRALPPDVEVFFVRDKTDKVVAVARWYGKRPRQIAVTFR
jgi:hypothetical protein